MCFIIPPLQWRGWYTLIFFKQLSSKISQQALITDASKFNTLFVKPWDPFVLPMGHQLHVKCRTWLILNIYIRAVVSPVSTGS